MSVAIETWFRGVHFRSRLEARWAAMFDMLDWRWEYEPVDLDGYIPDFVLLVPAGEVLVEVKPAFTVKALEAAAGKIDRSGWKSTNINDALIVGATWNPSGEYTYHPAAGTLRQRMPDEGFCWEEAGWFGCRGCGRTSVFHQAQGYDCTVNGCYDGDGHLGEAPDLEAMWREAGNVVRWEGRR